MFDLPFYEPDNAEGVERSLMEVAGELANTWGVEGPFFVDFSRYGPDHKCSNGYHPAEHFFSCARQLRLQAIPVAGPESVRGPGSRYLEAVAAIARDDQRGAAIRVPIDAITGSASLASIAFSVMRTLALPANMIDLFIDFEAIDRLPQGLQGVRAIVAMLEDFLSTLDIAQFRNVVITGCSLPDRVPKKYNWTPLRVPRMELSAWTEVNARRSNVPISYGDYGIAYPFEDDPDGPVIPPSRIRLSTDTEYVLHRAPQGEYRRLCAYVSTTTDFDRSLVAWGAQEIMQGGTSGPGAPREWVARDTNLHIERTRLILERELEHRGVLATLSFGEPDPVPYLQHRLAE